MCIIAAKPKGVKMPNKSTIENMWYNNHDGAGFMYAKDGVVHIEKGFMKLTDFESALERVSKKVNLDDVSIVMHFRIATHGGVSPANTHPFPVSSSMGILQKLKSTATLGVAHNGIINITPRKGVSDTMEYVASQLAPLYKGVPKFYLNPHLMEMVDNAIQSKLALLNGDGELYTIGKFETDDGILYSNTSYKPYTFYGKYWKDIWADYPGPYETYDDLPAGYSHIGEKLLRWFDYDEEVTCLDGRNRLIDSFELDCAVDRDGNLYEYDYKIGGFVKIKGGRAFDRNGDPMYAVPDDNYCTTIEDIYDYTPILLNKVKNKDKKK